MKKVIFTVFSGAVVVGLVYGFIKFLPKIIKNDEARITFIKTSSKTISKECNNTSITVTAKVTSQTGLKKVFLWHRLADYPTYTEVEMEREGSLFSATVKAEDIPGKAYGTWEFYISSEDISENTIKSKVDRSVEMLNCVSQ